MTLVVVTWDRLVIHLAMLEETKQLMNGVFEANAFRVPCRGPQSRNESLGHAGPHGPLSARGTSRGSRGKKRAGQALRMTFPPSFDCLYIPNDD